MQALGLRQHIRQLGDSFQVDVVIISPLTRTLETAAGVFGTGAWRQGDEAPAFMLPQSGVEVRKQRAPGALVPSWRRSGLVVALLPGVRLQSQHARTPSPAFCAMPLT